MPHRAVPAAPRPAAARRRAAAGAGALALLALAGCLPFGRRGSQVISSERSDYAPVVRLDVTTRAAGDSVVVDVAGGSVLSPSYGGTSAAPNMRALQLAALLVATPADAADSAGVAGARPWAPVVEGAPAPLADSLVPGVAQPVAPRRWVLRRPAGAPDPRRTWVVFRITGDAMTSAVRMADGGEVPAQRVNGGVRVYACATRDVTGRRDRARERVMRRSYEAGC